MGVPVISQVNIAMCFFSIYDALLMNSAALDEQVSSTKTDLTTFESRE